MKKYYSIFLALTLLIGLSGCEDALKDPTSAEIALGIEGEWSVDETSSIFDNNTPLYKAAMQTYSVSISVSESDSTLIYIDNFYGLGNNVYAEARVMGHSLRLTPNQVLSGGYTLSEGSATINKNLQEIKLNYAVDDGSGELDQVAATYTFKY